MKYEPLFPLYRGQMNRDVFGKIMGFVSLRSYPSIRLVSKEICSMLSDIAKGIPIEALLEAGIIPLFLSPITHTDFLEHYIPKLLSSVTPFEFFLIAKRASKNSFRNYERIKQITESIRKPAGRTGICPHRYALDSYDPTASLTSGLKAILFMFCMWIMLYLELLSIDLLSIGLPFIAFLAIAMIPLSTNRIYMFLEERRA